jgi:protein arginine kinase
MTQDIALQNDVALTSRARAMRNLRQELFPNRASSEDQVRVMQQILGVAKQVLPEGNILKGITLKEREKLVGKRLISPNFSWTLPGRAVITSKDETLSIMINEEDHLRVQVIRPGLQIGTVVHELNAVLSQFENKLSFAKDDIHGYLASSIFNTGPGTRFSVMLHLVGLGYYKQLPEMLQALVNEGITVRGLYGEGSRPVGAFAQVSTTVASLETFVGTTEYLIKREREARAEIGPSILESKAEQALLYLKSSPRVTLPDAFRVLGWLRWASSTGLPGYPFKISQLDQALSSLDLLTHESVEHADGRRADTLRQLLKQ